MIRTSAIIAAAMVSMTAALAQEELAETAGAETSQASAETLAEAPSETLGALDWPTPVPVDFVCPFKDELDYEPGEISCGFISVPENRENADSRMIRLHFVKIAATGEEEDHREDPVIYLTGGPGVGVDGYVERLREHAILDQRDLYILEQRGIGASGDFCPHYGLTQRALVHAEDIEEAQRNAADVTGNCFAQAAAAGVDLSGYNTVENARDVKALREALGFEQWNVWGISYGSHLGQMLVLQDPEGISALVIDAIVPNDLNDLMRIGRWANLTLENIFSTCTELAICEDLEARLDAAIDAVRNDPVSVTVDDTELYPQGEIEVGGLILAFAPFSMAYEQDEHPAIPAVLDTLIGYYETRDPAFFQLATETDDGPGGITISQGMSAAIRCNDGYVHAAADVTAEDLAENPRFEGLLATASGAAYTAQMCVDQGVGPRDRADYAFVETDIPTLIVNGAWDPVTPPPLARYIAPGFSNGRYIEVPFAGHGPTRSMSDCAGPVLNAFFDDPDPSALDATCLEEGVPSPDYLALTPTRAPVLLASAAADDPKNLVVPGLWAGVPLLVLLLGLLMIPFGTFARIIDRQPAAEIKADMALVRGLGFLTTIAGVGFAALTGYGFYAASEVSTLAIVAGLHPVASLAPWLGLASGLLGLLVLITLVQRRMSEGPIRFGSLTGLFLIGVSGVALAAFALAYDLGPL